MPANWQTVRVFISSTFRDMQAERDHLVTVVFPELRERVEQLGLEFFDVDLRWGVPAKDANDEPPTSGNTAGNGLTAWSRSSSASSASRRSGKSVALPDASPVCSGAATPILPCWS